MSTASTTHAPRRAGFTLLELMIALVAGALVISSVYFIGAASARSFQTQQRLAQLQTNVRLAMDQLTHDVGRAGLLATPNSRRDQRCVAPATELQAVEFRNDVDTAMIPQAGFNGVTADRLFLVGSYATADAYLVSTVDAAGTTLGLQQAWQGFQRSFGAAPLVGGAGSPYDSTFIPGRVVRLTTDAGNVFYGTIVSASAPSATVTIAPPLPVGTSCLGGLADHALLSVLSRIEYHIDNGGGFSSASLQPNNPLVTGPPSWLVRREVTFDAAALPLAIQGPTGAGPSERVVLENAIDFNLTFTLDRQPNMSLPANLVRFDGATAAPLLANTNTSPAVTPEQVRAIFISISGRTPDLDPRFGYAATPPLTHFTFDPVPASHLARGSAHVRTLRSEVFLQNAMAR